MVKTGVIHLGLGAFHRAHQAPIFDTLLAQGDPRWGVTGVAIRSRGVIDALRSQDGLYSLSTRDGTGVHWRVIASLKGLLNASYEPDLVIASIAAPDTHIVTLTITEKGYLDSGPTGPAGLLAQALERRRIGGDGPLTVMSCDNRTGNGAVARDAVIRAAGALYLPDAALRWIADEVAFPSAMVDRITPATTEGLLDEAEQMLGLRDDAAVRTEGFWQWVVEDHFAAARPEFAKAGVQLVATVEPWEKAKLRLLNAAHSTLAYHGLICGHRFVHEAIADPALFQLVEQVWNEATETLDRSVIDVASYRQELLERFANPALEHRLLQIAADGSQKMPPRLLDTMMDRAALGLSSRALSIALAGWIEALATIDGISDPLLTVLRGLARHDNPVPPILDRLNYPSHLAVEIATELQDLRGFRR